MSRVPPVAAVWVMLVAAGCAVGRYDADYAKAVERHRQGLPFQPTKPAASEPAPGEAPAPAGEGAGEPAPEPAPAAP